MKAVIYYVALFCLFISNAQNLSIHTRTLNDTVYIDYVNPLLAPVDVNITIKEKYKDFISAKSQFYIQSKDTIINAVTIPASLFNNDKKNLNDFVKTSGQFGDPNYIKPNKDYLYTLPFPKGKKYKIMQGFNGKFSHNYDGARYALDFEIKIGDTITAARNGIVIFTKEDSKERGRTRAASGKANKIIVMHNDGTYAQYVHLDYNGVLVSEGDQISVGQAIGISGFTGFTTSPHLHFVVKRDKEISIPFNFKNFKNQELKQGKRYKRKL